MASMPGPHGPEKNRRKSHKKSRNGCLACKDRRVRCDEGKPICSRCLLYGDACVYAASMVRVRNARPPQTAWLEMILPATPADPFNAMPIPMLYRSNELFYHFTTYRTRIRNSIPNNPNSGIAHDMINPTWFRTVLLLAAGHNSLVRDSFGALTETYVHHKLKIIQAVKSHLSDDREEVFRWVVSVISGVIFANKGIGEDEEAEAHLRGLFAMLDLNERKQGVSLYIILLRRITVIGVSLITAARRGIPRGRPEGGASATTTSDRERRAWAEISYLYSHLVIEFLRDILLAPSKNDLCDKGFYRVDLPLLRWLRDRLRSVCSKRQQACEARLEMSRNIAPPGNTPEECFSWTTAVGAYALTIGVSQRGTGSNGPSARPMVDKTHNWIDEKIRLWRLAERPLVDLCLAEVLQKIGWLRSGEGIRFVEEVCLDAEEMTRVNIEHRRLNGECRE